MQVETIFRFLEQHVFVHEDNFVFYRRKNVLHFDETTNSSHEGTNNGLKSHSAAVLPSMDVLTSAQHIQFQTDITMKELDRAACKNTVNTNLHASIPTTNKVGPLLNSILEQQWDKRHNYYVRRNSTKYEWLVVVKEDCSSKYHVVDYDIINPYNKFIPRFRRIRFVKMDNDRQMKCSCCLFSRFRFGCVHILSVMSFENPSYDGYTQNDVRVFWWNDYNFYCKRETDYEKGGDWSLHFLQLLDNDISGPRMPETWTAGPFLAQSNIQELNEDSIFAVKAAVESVRNYSAQQAKSALKTFSDCYSQLCNVDTDSDFDAESDFENANVPVDMDTDTDGAANFNTFEVCQCRISQRSVL